MTKIGLKQHLTLLHVLRLHKNDSIMFVNKNNDVVYFMIKNKKYILFIIGLYWQGECTHRFSH